MKFFIFLKYLGEESVEAIGRSYGFVISPLLLRGFFLKSWILPIFTEFTTSSWGSLLWFSGCLGFLSIHGLFIVRNWLSIRPSTTNLSPIQPSNPPTTPPPLHLTIATTNPQTINVITSPKRMAITINPGWAMVISTAGSRS